MKIYCPVVGECPHQPITVFKNRFFLIEPFNEEKDVRERIIDNSLKQVFGTENYELLTSEQEISDRGIYCDICKKIASSEYCITDLTPELVGDRLIIRPNVALELGLAFGLHKPSLILSKKIEGQRLIPSDIYFIRYINISFDDWSSLEKKLITMMREICIGKVQALPIPISLQETILQTAKEFRTIINSLENQERIYYNCKVIKYIYNLRREIIAIVTNARFLNLSMRLSIFQVSEEIEKEIGVLECWHIQPIEEISQCICYSPEESRLIWKEIEEKIIQHGYCNAENNRLKPIIPNGLSKQNISMLKSQLELFDNFIL